MRGKRSKQYKKLMQQYGLNFGFREPYQVILDADIIKDASKFKMDLVGGLERTLHGKVKPMITQCSMRHLYASSFEPGMSHIIDTAKTYERRRCGHLPADYPVPLSSEACITSVVDPKNTLQNKHRYIVASQDLDVRKAMRDLAGVPLVYIHRSVMIMEPMGTKTSEIRQKEEQGKFRSGLRMGNKNLKRKRDGEEEYPRICEDKTSQKKTNWGIKGPNPLAVKKSKKKNEKDSVVAKLIESKNDNESTETKMDQNKDTELILKKKRIRKHKSVSNNEAHIITSSHEVD
ncbi:Bgt-2520 [Blumeria graminis f. sp. tritici]|uniref:U three protein 23 n=3 Tax=Blumeria graminis f. sp. tritici TaxID=62690 RepID=A0A656KQR7_BLUGR|nr:hypothetical protein BGT96224_2520 [Blumeria graminis f. sp. tritici 96224]VDB90760.1 Bgt-2520 [Blumeria graminis f. sp. tritici]